jgi:ribonuclease HII
MISLGVDEVGRGCWAGPLVVGVCALKHTIDGLKDSKSLTKQQRQRLVEQIKSKAVAYSLGWVSAQEIDALGLTQATGLAINRALKDIKIDYDELIIDGNVNFIKDNLKARTQIRADQSVASVQAASVLAKTARDEHMLKQALIYPNYGFDKHVGYGTALHRQQLERYGLCDLHRLSFKPIRQWL